MPKSRQKDRLPKSLAPLLIGVAGLIVITIGALVIFPELKNVIPSSSKSKAQFNADRINESSGLTLAANRLTPDIKVDFIPYVDQRIVLWLLIFSGCI
jgi:hypothetical protein